MYVDGCVIYDILLLCMYKFLCVTICEDDKTLAETRRRPYMNK